jgi:hypothetical protein
LVTGEDRVSRWPYPGFISVHRDRSLGCRVFIAMNPGLHR